MWQQIMPRHQRINHELLPTDTISKVIHNRAKRALEATRSEVVNNFAVRQKMNFTHTPTIAPVVPMKNKRWNSFSATNASLIEAKLAYVTLNMQTPKTFGAVPVNSGRTWEAVSLYSCRIELR
jgi:hypothetical protein